METFQAPFSAPSNFQPLPEQVPIQELHKFANHVAQKPDSPEKDAEIGRTIVDWRRRLASNLLSNQEYIQLLRTFGIERT